MAGWAFYAGVRGGGQVMVDDTLYGARGAKGDLGAVPSASTTRRCSTCRGARHGSPAGSSPGTCCRSTRCTSPSPPPRGSWPRRHAPRSSSLGFRLDRRRARPQRWRSSSPGTGCSSSASTGSARRPTGSSTTPKFPAVQSAPFHCSAARARENVFWALASGRADLDGMGGRDALADGPGHDSVGVSWSRPSDLVRRAAAASSRSGGRCTSTRSIE